MWGGWVRELADRIEAAWRAAAGRSPPRCPRRRRRDRPGHAHGGLAATPMSRIRTSVVEAIVGAGVRADEAERIVDAAWHAPDPVVLARPVTDLRALFAGLADRRNPDRGGDERRSRPDGTDARAPGRRRPRRGLACADDGHPVKPAPDAVHRICRALGVPEARTAVIGDSPADLAMGRAAGVAPGDRRPDRRRRSGDASTPLADLVLDSVAGPPAPDLIPARRASRRLGPSGCRVPVLTVLSFPTLAAATFAEVPAVRGRTVNSYPAAARRDRSGGTSNLMALAARATASAELLTLSEAASVAGVHRDTVRAWCSTGRLAVDRRAAPRRSPSPACGPRPRPGGSAAGRSRKLGPDPRLRHVGGRAQRPPARGAAEPRRGCPAPARVGAVRFGGPRPAVRGGPRQLDAPVPRRPCRPLAVGQRAQASARARRVAERPHRARHLRRWPVCQLRDGRLRGVAQRDGARLSRCL